MDFFDSVLSDSMTCVDKVDEVPLALADSRFTVTFTPPENFYEEQVEKLTLQALIICQKSK